MNGFTRRAFVASSSFACLSFGAAFSSEGAINLSWKDLRHPDDPSALDLMQVRVDHSTGAPAALQPPSMGPRTEWDGKRVSIPGFILPVVRTPQGIRTFVLAPFVPPCMHAPPPAANQLAMVTASTPYNNSGVFEVVEVTGVIRTKTISEGASEVSYVIMADHVERVDELKRRDYMTRFSNQDCASSTRRPQCIG